MKRYFPCSLVRVGSFCPAVPRVSAVLAGGCCWNRAGPAAAEPSAGKPKIRLVFCETTNDKPIWPNIGYDFDARRKQCSRC